MEPVSITNKPKCIFILDSLYQLNEGGQIISYHKRNPRKIITKRIDRAGYYTVRLSSKGVTKTYLLHRLLATYFIPNPDNKPFVNHINGNKLDYRLCNLEWSSHAENIQHAYSTGLCKAAEYNSKKVIDICTGKEYKSVVEAAKAYHIPYATCKNYLNGNRSNPTCLRLTYLKQSA